MGMRVVSEIFESDRITQGNVDETMVGKSGHHGEGSGFLTSTLGACGNKESNIFSSKLASSPELASGVPECLNQGLFCAPDTPLRGHTFHWPGMLP
jgi:hypothetical protein